jgi:2-oxoglutarate-Fe(II)-dependent oxygenase superfamily protein
MPGPRRRRIRWEGFEPVGAASTLGDLWRADPGQTFYDLLDGVKSGLTVDAEPGTVVAFSSEMRHGVLPVSHGERFTVVTWFH